MGSYINKIIGTNEEIIKDAEVSLIPHVILIINLAIPIFFITFIPSITLATGIFDFLCKMIFFAIINPLVWILLLFVIRAIIYKYNTEFAITNKRIVAKRGGLIRRGAIELLIPKIESVQVDQPALGRIFNYGTIVISGAGNPQAPIYGIKDPFEIRKALVDLMERCQQK